MKKIIQLGIMWTIIIAGVSLLLAREGIGLREATLPVFLSGALFGAICIFLKWWASLFTLNNALAGMFGFYLVATSTLTNAIMIGCLLGFCASLIVLLGVAGVFQKTGVNLGFWRVYLISVCEAAVVYAAIAYGRTLII